MFYYLNKTKHKFLKIPYYYKLNDIFTTIPFLLPTKDILYKFIENFKLNYPKSYLFKITLYGGYNSNSENTSDVDITISYNDISHKNYQDIYDCMYFLTSTSIKMFNMKIDLFYVDKHYNRINTKIMNFLITQNIEKLKEHDQIKNVIQGERITIVKSETVKSKKHTYHHVINEKKNLIINLNNKKILIKKKDDDKLGGWDKQLKYVKRGRFYYNDVILIQNNIINNEYFKI